MLYASQFLLHERSDIGQCVGTCFMLRLNRAERHSAPITLDPTRGRYVVELIIRCHAAGNTLPAAGNGDPATMRGLPEQ